MLVSHLRFFSSGIDYFLVRQKKPHDPGSRRGDAAHVKPQGEEHVRHDDKEDWGGEVGEERLAAYLLFLIIFNERGDQGDDEPEVDQGERVILP